MSHAKLLKQRINDAIEAGKYRSKGTPRAKDETKPKEEPPKEPAKRTDPPAPKREPLDHASFVGGLARRRIDAVEGGIEKALNDKFKGKK